MHMELIPLIFKNSDRRSNNRRYTEVHYQQQSQNAMNIAVRNGSLQIAHLLWTNGASYALVSKRALTRSLLQRILVDISKLLYQAYRVAYWHWRNAGYLGLDLAYRAYIYCRNFSCWYTQRQFECGHPRSTSTKQHTK
jgi:hypothetical protein